MTTIIDRQLELYFDDVFDRQEGAVDVPRETVRFADGSNPRPNACHANVDRFVAETPGCSAIRGWAVSARMGASIILDAHSVVSRSDGSWIDITLTPDHHRALFIAHSGGEAEFDAVRSRVNQIPWPPAGRLSST